MAHWHDFNPWADTIVYIPSLEELAECVTGRSVKECVDRWIAQSKLYGTPGKLDAYILPQPSGFHDIGVRWGERPEYYFSPGAIKDKTQALLDKYGPKGA